MMRTRRRKRYIRLLDALMPVITVVMYIITRVCVGVAVYISAFMLIWLLFK